MSFLILFGLTILSLGFPLLITRVKVSRLDRLSWEELVAKLEPVSAAGISTVALDYLQPVKGQISIEPDALWALIGEAEGMHRMYANAEVLIALAAYARRWNFHESVIVSERMRRDGVALRRAATRLLLGSMLGYGKLRGPFYVQEAASAYYLMRQRLLALYETSHAGRYPLLAAAV